MSAGEKTGQITEKREADPKLFYLELVFIFLLALVPRLLYIFVFSNPNIPGWYTDVFHHWQIAYLSREIGFHQGFLRLWDLKGMEFFWGLLHPLVLIILFDITGSISILIPRLLSTFGGSISIVFLFLLIKRHFNTTTAWAVAIFASLFPITLFSNTAGMQEELGLPLILGSFLLWPSYPFITGLLLAIASMVRSEYWLFGMGLVASLIFISKRKDKVILAILGYAVPILFYMKYLANYTGSFIYPIQTNFFASVRGDWFADLPVIGEKLLAKRISQGIFGFGIIGAVLTIFKKPKSYLLYLFGFGNIIFIGFMVGFGAYVKGYIPRFWVDRLYNWPYLFTSVLIIIFLFYYLPRLLPKMRRIVSIFSWITLTFGIIVSQLIWRPINFFMQPAVATYNSEKASSVEIAKAYQGGGILLPEDHPFITYFLAHDDGVKGREMVGEMFDPFFYFKNQVDLFSNWREDREVVIDWLKSNNIKLMVFTTTKASYIGLIKREPQLFELVPAKGGFIIYRVKI